MEDEKQYKLDDPKVIKLILRIFYICCVLLFLADIVYHRHAVRDWEGWWGFYAIYGFVGCVLLVLIAKWMRKIVMRPEDYYDKQELKGDDHHVDA